MPETIDVELVADTQGLETALKNLEDRSRQFGNVLTSALKGAVVQGKSLEDTLKGIALSLAGMALDAALKPLSGLFSSAFSGLLGGILPFAKGGMTGGVQAFADGGVVASPTYFPSGSGIGLMGEAGAEAILPLQRGADGRLGHQHFNARCAVVHEITGADHGHGGARFRTWQPLSLRSDNAGLARIS
jgi:lambda family phage tail tape measure protein